MVSTARTDRRSPPAGWHDDPLHYDAQQFDQSRRRRQMVGYARYRLPWQLFDRLYSALSVGAGRGSRQAYSRPSALSDRTSVVYGKSVSVGVDLGGRRIIIKKKKTRQQTTNEI